MKTIRPLLLIASFISLTTIVQAQVFSNVRPEQVPSGMEYSLQQPNIESSTLFQGKHVAILAANGVEESEITFPYIYLTQRGAQVDIIVPSWSANGIVAVKYLKPTLWVKGSRTFTQAKTMHYDLLVLTGGAWNAQVVRSDNEAINLILSHYNQGRPLAAICAGSSLLINAGLARGRALTGSPVIRIDLINAGARYLDQALVVNQNIATSRSPNDLPNFVQGLKYLLLEK